MGIINQLDIQTANLIAAGEVVDRPASAVKELIENSIDAGASVVTIEIKGGGSSLIRVSDNGKGMERDDLPLAIKRHATSKIKTAQDLNAIMTLGFRGEALAAIASVSHLRILTKRREDMFGTQLEVSPGSQPELTEIAISDGTTVIVENLFENVPARRKFLKKDVTEATAVAANVEKAALSNPQVSVRMISDGQTRFCTAGDGKLKNTIYSLFGREFSTRMIPVDQTVDGIRVYGFIGTPDNIRANRNYQNFFVNRRYVKSRCAQSALEQAFISYAPSEKFPTCVLFIEIPPQTVDVNVHPAKLEVKFSNEKVIFETVYSAVRGSLESKISRPQLAIPNIGNANVIQPKKTLSNAFIPLEDRSASVPKPPYLNQKNVKQGQISIDDLEQDNNLSVLNQKSYNSVTANSDSQLDIVHKLPPEIDILTGSPSWERQKQEKFTKSNENFGMPPLPPELDEQFAPNEIRQNDEKQSDNCKTEVDIEPEISADSNNDVKIAEKNVAQDNVSESTTPEIPSAFRQSPLPYRIIGEAFYSYVFIEQADKILIIDKHAAHERIIFEELKQNLASNSVVSQLMLVPLEVNLTPDELQAVSEHHSEIEKIGFIFEEKPPRILSVSGIPQQIEPESVSGVLETLAGQLSSGTGSTEISNQLLFEKALYQASCKAAIKAGHLEDAEHIKWICDRLLSLNDIKFCPHGRPVAFEISKSNIEHQFKRT